MNEVKNGDSIIVGLILDEENSEAALTFGPSPETKEGKAQLLDFNNFWNTKAELRKFKDGTIRAVVEWKPHPQKFVIFEITNYLIEEHFGSEVAASLSFQNKGLLKLLNVPNRPKVNSLPINSLLSYQEKRDSFQKLINSFSEFQKHLNLKIKNILPMSSSLRDSSITAPSPFDLDADDSVGWGIIEFETSDKWPESIRAVEQTKTALLLKIAELLGKQSHYKVCVGTESSVVMENDFVRFLQVETNDGFIFRFRIQSPVDLYLYQELDKQNQTTSYSTRYIQLYSGAISHTQQIQIASRRYKFYSAAVRLLKSWFNSHLLTSQVKQEFIELIALKPFLDSAPYVPPHSPSSAFFRSLEFLANWNWKEEPLILDFSNKSTDNEVNHFIKFSDVEGVGMDSAEYSQYQKAFAALRKDDPSLQKAAMFIGTVSDPSGILWTQLIPPSSLGIAIASRITALSRASLNVVTKSRASEGFQIAQIFQPSVNDFDIVIHVRDPQFDSSDEKRVLKKKKTGTYRNLQTKTSFPPREEVMRHLNPATDLFFKDLQKLYDGTIIFFKGTLSNPHEPSIIAGIWHQDVINPCPFKVNLGYSTIPDTDASKKGIVVLNKQAIMEEISQIGGELIEKIQLRK